MQRLSVVFALILAVFVAGCDSMHNTQYVIKNASVADRAHIKHSLESAAALTGLSDQTKTSIVPNTIAFYQEPVPHFSVNLGARMVGDAAVVDLMCFHPGWRKPDKYKIIESRLEKDFTLNFPSRFTMTDDWQKMSHPLVVKQTCPATDLCGQKSKEVPK